MTEIISHPIAFRVPAACAAAGISRTRLYQLISEGKIEAKACGGRTLILAASLHAFLASLPSAPTAARRKR
jgi:excisionase family DNA binding protein